MKKLIITVTLLLITTIAMSQPKNTSSVIYDTTKIGKCAYILAGKLYTNNYAKIVKVNPDPSVLQIDPYTMKYYQQWYNFKLILLKTKKEYLITQGTGELVVNQVKIVSFILN